MARTGLMMATLRVMDGMNGVEARVDASEVEAALAAKITKLTSDERWFLSALDVTEDGAWEARHMSEDSERMAKRLARRGLCHRSTFRNERGRLSLQFERIGEVSWALIAFDEAQAAKEREADAATQAKAQTLPARLTCECGNTSGGTAWWWDARLWVIGANGPVCPVCLRPGIATHAAQGESINWWGCGE